MILGVILHLNGNLSTFQQSGNLTHDPRQVTIHMGSATDTKRALALTTNKIKSSLFRLFRWTPEFEVGKDSAIATVLVKLYNLPLHYFDEASLVWLGSLLSTVLHIHPSTLALTSQQYAKICVEMDVSKPFLKNLWIGTLKEYEWMVSLEYEGNQAYCTYCGLLGHMEGLCRKNRNVQGNNNLVATKEKLTNNNKTSKTREWVAKKADNA